MKVACPHCGASYKVDDRRVPAGGLNVRCPKCRETFPVRREASLDEAVPLPAPAAAPRAPPPVPKQGAMPVRPPPVPPPPPGSAGRIPGPRSKPTVGMEPELATEAVPLPAPARPAPAGFDVLPQEPLPAAPDPFEATPQPSASGPEPLPPVPHEVPLLELGSPQPRAASAEPEEPLAFGEIDIDAPTSPVAPFSPDPSTAEGPPPPGPPSPPAEPTAGEELEMLFGDGAAGAAAPAGRGKAAGYKVRRRSGKIFGPFDEAQIAEMLSNAELLGNEDVSPDGGATWSPIGSVAAFGEALRKSAAEPPPVGRSPAGQRPTPFGDRMASAKVVAEGASPETRPKRKIAVAAAAVLVVAALGAGVVLTPYGSSLVKLFRRGDTAKVAAFQAQARGALDRAEYPADRAALDSAARAVAADPESAEAAALHAMIVAALELRHGAPPGALDQARRAADRLDTSAKSTIPALAARLAVSLSDAPGASTLPYEAALEQASARAPPDADVLALLARSALARGDVPRALAFYTRLESLRPGTPRAGHGMGLALLAKHDLDGARAAFEKVLAAAPGHLASRLELAALAEAEGNAAQAEQHLAALLAPGAETQLAPAERARALAVKGALLARARRSSKDADEALEAAVQADPRLVGARVTLSRRRLRRGDAAGAVAALEPVAAQAAAVPALGAARIRALAAAGRALDASSLADEALRRNPGDPALLVAKAAAAAAAGKVDDAVALYRDAAARDPAAFEPRLALGRIALARRDLAQARVELAAAAEKGPREPGAHSALAELAAAAGDEGAAQRSFEAALALDAQYAPAHIGLARLALARGDRAAARARIERALAADPQNVEGHIVLGTLLWSAKDLAGAEEAFRAALALQPRNVGAMWRLGSVQLERGGNLDEAVQRLTEASNEEPQRAEIRQWLGRALLRRGETPGAIAQLRRAVELDPKDPEHRLHLGAALERSGSIVEAIDEYRAAAAADPKLPDPHERLGLAFAANGRFDEAAAAYQKAVAAAPKVSRLRIALADCNTRLGKYEDALRGYRAVLKADPAAKQVPYKLARALHEAQGAKAALPWYERAARDDRDNPMPHYYLGYLYKERGHKAKAVAEFKRFLALKPDADERKDIEAEIEDLR